MQTTRPLGFALTVLALTFAGESATRPVAAGTGSHRDHSGNISTSTTGDDVRSCGDISIQFGDRDAVRSEQVLTGAGPRGPLNLSLPANSGAWFHGSARRDWSILACKAASSPSALNAVSVTFQRGELEARGPDTESWLVYYVIEGPGNADIDGATHNGPLRFAGVSGGHIRATTENGPLSFRDCAGTIDARSNNGPISLEHVSGDVSASTQNGPVSVTDSSGNVKVDTKNGPISVRLSGDTWRDGGLEAHAGNGPLSLRIPDGYRTATIVESTGHSPVQCRGGACDSARRTSNDDSRRITFGEGTAAVVRLSTVNGPVSIDSARGE